MRQIDIVFEQFSYFSPLISHMLTITEKNASVFSHNFYKKNIMEFRLFQIEIIFYLDIAYCSISCTGKLLNENLE